MEVQTKRAKGDNEEQEKEDEEDMEEEDPDLERMRGLSYSQVGKLDLYTVK